MSSYWALAPWAVAWPEPSWAGAAGEALAAYTEQRCLTEFPRDVLRSTSFDDHLLMNIV